MNTHTPSAIDLYWLPLGAGGYSVRLNGKVFEWFAARREHRDRCDLYHSALQVYVPEGRFVIEQAPAWGEGSRRGVVAEGAVGARAFGRFRIFRYEIRSWREGVIPDIAEAVESPLRLSEEPQQAQGAGENVLRLALVQRPVAVLPFGAHRGRITRSMIGSTDLREADVQQPKMVATRSSVISRSASS